MSVILGHGANIVMFASHLDNIIANVSKKYC